MGSTSSWDKGYGITSVGSNKIAVTGYFQGDATFGDVVLPPKGNQYDFFVFITLVSVSTLLFAIN